MATRSIVPFGPQHPVLPEPIHLDLVIEDEKVVNCHPPCRAALLESEELRCWRKGWGPWAGTWRRKAGSGPSSCVGVSHQREDLAWSRTDSPLLHSRHSVPGRDQHSNPDTVS